MVHQEEVPGFYVSPLDIVLQRRYCLPRLVVVAVTRSAPVRDVLDIVDH